MDAGAEFDRDLAMMRRAQALADSARRRTAPNPWVGCVLVQDGRVVGEGSTRPPGGAHAEVEALAAAGDEARGATAYVTLEPCGHQGRTPPCTSALIDAGIARVVVALEDPDPHVRGAGLAALRSAGVTVEIGVGVDAARRSLAPYLVHRTQGRSFCLLKTAMSLDGRIAAADGTSRWITGPVARVDAHELRADSQAVVVGAGTASSDRPSLTARETVAPVERQPLRVLLDARGRVPADGPLFDANGPTLVLTTDAAPVEASDAWLAAGAKVIAIAPGSQGRGVDPLAALETLAGLGVLQALVEGGAHVAGSFLAAGVVDRLVTYVAPMVLGDAGLAAFAGSGPASLGDAAPLAVVDLRALGNDVRIEYERRVGV